MKPSELLSAAVGDLKTCITHGIEVDMNHWLTLENEEVCTVCLAGAYLVQSMGYEPTRDNPLLQDLPNKYELMALNHFRGGNIREALERLLLYADIPSVVVISYQHSPEQFFGCMERIVTLLEEKNL